MFYCQIVTGIARNPTERGPFGQGKRVNQIELKDEMLRREEEDELIVDWDCDGMICELEAEESKRIFVADK